MPFCTIASGPSPVEAFAAAELARYLHRMTGEWQDPCAREGTPTASPGRTIFVGIDAYAEQTKKPRARAMLRGLPPDGFVCRSVPEGLLLAGATPRATLYAVYTWLEALGVRWFFPGEGGEVIPLAKPEEVQLDAGWRLREAPAFAKRGIVIEPRNSALPEWIDFAAKKRLTTVAIHHWQELDRVRALAIPRGIEVEVEMHLLAKGLCSRDPAHHQRDREALEGMLEHLPADMREYFLWQADGDRATCECPADRGLSVTDLTLRVYNRLADLLRRRRPAARLAFLIYLGTWEPPRQGTRPAPGLFGEFAPIHRCMAHGVDDPACPANRRDISPVLDRWADVFAPEEAQILDYWLDSSLFGRERFRAHAGRVPHIGNAIRHDARSYFARGFRTATTFVVGVDRAYLDRWITPPLFQYPALLWNPERDAESLLSDFAQRWLGTSDALVGLEALAHLDTAGLEHGRPTDGDVVLERAQRRIADLSGQLPEEPFRSRLERLSAELEFRSSWRDVVR